MWERKISRLLPRLIIFFCYINARLISLCISVLDFFCVFTHITFVHMLIYFDACFTGRCYYVVGFFIGLISTLFLLLFQDNKCLYGRARTRRTGSSKRFLTLTRKVTASRPSTRRWSYVSATAIMWRTLISSPTTQGFFLIACIPRIAD